MNFNMLKDLLFVTESTNVLINFEFNTTYNANFHVITYELSVIQW